jgi:hypothetical protein
MDRMTDAISDLVAAVNQANVQLGQPASRLLASQQRHGRRPQLPRSAAR